MKKLSNLLKTGILFFGISLLLWNCEKDENSHVHQEHEIAKIEYLDIEELPEIESALFGLNKTSTTKKSDTQGRSMQTNFGSLKLNNILEYANNDGKLTYSFSIDKEFSDNHPYAFENLHLIKLEEGYLGYIIKWEPNDVWLENNNYNFILSDFTGTKTHYDLDYKIIQVTEFINGESIDYSTDNRTSSKNQTFSREVEISCVDVIGSLCSGDPYDCGGSICGFGSATFCSVSGGGGSSAGNSSPTGSSGTRLPRGGGSGGSTNGNAFVVPVIPSPLELAINSFFNSLTDQEKEFLDNNNLVKEEVAKFLAKNYTPNTSLEDNSATNNPFNFAKEAVKILSLLELSETDTLDTFKNRILKMTTHLKQFGNPEDEFFADYIESVVPDFNSMIIGDVYDIYKLTRSQVHNLTRKYLDAVVIPFAEAAYPFVIYAVTEATLGAALPLLSRIPLSMVLRGARLNKMVIQTTKLSVQGGNANIRLINGSSIAKAESLFAVLTKNKIGNLVEVAPNVLRANMGSENYIIFRTASGTQSPGVIATVEYNFTQLLGTNSYKLKFYP